MKIYIQKNKVSYDNTNKTFFVKGKGIQFASKHELINEKTGNFSMFELEGSNGSEWDPNTIWKYVNENGYILNIGNDDVTKQHADAYLAAKMRKFNNFIKG